MADSKQTELCTYLSAILLAGLLLNALNIFHARRFLSDSQRFDRFINASFESEMHTSKRLPAPTAILLLQLILSRATGAKHRIYTSICLFTESY